MRFWVIKCLMSRILVAYMLIYLYLFLYCTLFNISFARFSFGSFIMYLMHLRSLLRPLWKWVFLSVIGISSLIICCLTVMAILNFRILGCVSPWTVVVFRILVRMTMEWEGMSNLHWRVAAILICILHQCGPNRNSYCTGKKTGECWYALYYPRIDTSFIGLSSLGEILFSVSHETHILDIKCNHRLLVVKLVKLPLSLTLSLLFNCIRQLLFSCFCWLSKLGVIKLRVPA